MSHLITEEQVQFYQENGFVHVENLLSSVETEELTQYLEDVMYTQAEHSVQNSEGNLYYRVLNQRVNTWRDSAGMAKYVFNERFAEIARRLAGADAIRFFHDHALWKMPQDSKDTPWHQDFPYWPMNEPGALSIWIALDDVDEKNGCLMFVPKSFKAGKLKSISLVEPEDIFEYAKGTGVEDEKPVIVRLKKGSATFHNGLNFHYAHANKTDKPRRALAIIYMPDGTTYNGKPHICTDGQGLVKDQPIQGRFFPILARK